MRPALAHLASLALAASLLAGCAGGDGGAEPEADFGDLGLQATETTGVLRGVVVDAAVRPVAGVRITATGPGGAAVETVSTATGTFGLDGLAPGDWFVVANKSGYVQTQQSATVVAGVAEPPIVKILLEADPSTAPYVTAFRLEGFIQCSIRPMILAQQCGVTDEDVVNVNYEMDRAPHWIQSEMVWESTQAFGDELSLSIRCLPGDTDPSEKCPEGQRNIIRPEGRSPLVARINDTLIATWALGDTNPLSISIFAYGRSDLDMYNESQVDEAQEPYTGNPCLDWSGVIFPPGTCVRMTGPGFMVNQRFDVYSHVFYGYLPPETWQFSADGAPPPPL